MAIKTGKELKALVRASLPVISRKRYGSRKTSLTGAFYVAPFCKTKMTNFFQLISTKITTFFAIAIVTVTSILPWHGTNTNRPVATSTATSSATVSESATPSPSITRTTPKVKTKVEITPTPETTPAPQTTDNTPPIPNTQPKTYPIVPISVMNIGSMEPQLQVIAQNAYQEFLRTSNLNRLDESNQIEILIGIYSRMLREKIAATQQNISQLKQENPPAPTPTVTPAPTAVYVNTDAEAKLAELRQTLENIQNKPVPMNVIVGRTQQAYQDWIKNNSAIYSVILGSRYVNDLNAILRAYGL